MFFSCDLYRHLGHQAAEPRLEFLMSLNESLKLMKLQMLSIEHEPIWQISHLLFCSENNFDRQCNSGMRLVIQKRRRQGLCISQLCHANIRSCIGLRSIIQKADSFQCDS